MKKRICFLLAGVMILSLTACSGDEEPEETPEDQSEKETIGVSEETPESTVIPQDWVRYAPTEGEVFFLSEEETETTEDFEDQYIITLYDSNAKEVQTTGQRTIW